LRLKNLKVKDGNQAFNLYAHFNNKITFATCPPIPIENPKNSNKNSFPLLPPNPLQNFTILSHRPTKSKFIRSPPQTQTPKLLRTIKAEVWILRRRYAPQARPSHTAAPLGIGISVWCAKRKGRAVDRGTTWSCGFQVLCTD